MNNIPKGTTHVWTPAVEKDFIPAIIGKWFRRAYYKKISGVWFSYSLVGEWIKSGNPPEWFKTEKEEGYFVTIKKFIDPEFIPKKEIV